MDYRQSDKVGSTDREHLLDGSRGECTKDQMFKVQRETYKSSFETGTCQAGNRDTFGNLMVHSADTNEMILKAIDSKDPKTLEQILTTSLERSVQEKNHGEQCKHADGIQGIFSLRCPVTQLNILQFCVLYQQPASSGCLGEYLRVLSTVDYNSQGLDNDVDSMLLQSDKICAPVSRLFQLVFLKRNLLENMEPRTHKLSKYSAFEQAIIKGDHESIDQFLHVLRRQLSQLSDDSNKFIVDTIIERALRITILNDQGSMLAWLLYQEPFKSTNLESFDLLRHACREHAKHCVRFLLANQSVLRGLEDEKDGKTVLQESIELLRPIQPESEQDDLSIVNELCQATKNFAQQTSTPKEHLMKKHEATSANLSNRLSDLPNKAKGNVKNMLAQKKSILQKIPNDMAMRSNPDWHTSKSSMAPLLFYTVLFVIYVLNIFVINAKLNVWYFSMSTTTISLKLFATYCQSSRKKWLSNLVKPDDDLLDYKDEVLRKVPQHLICPKCRVVRTESTVHCPVADTCVDRYDQWSSWIGGPIGRANHGFYYAFLFFFWLDTFLVGWIDARSVTVTKCDLPEGQKCPLDFLCVAGICHVLPLHYIATCGGAFICLLFFFPSQWLCCKHTHYFRVGQTTFQRNRSQHWIDMAFMDSWRMKEAREASLKEKRCCHFYEMTCLRKVKRQQELLEEASQLDQLVNVTAAFSDTKVGSDHQ